MSRPFRIALLGAVAAVFLLLPLIVFSVARAMNEGEVAPNVMVAGVHVGGLSAEDATIQVVEYETTLRETPAPFVVKGRPFDLDPRIVSLDLDEEAAVAAAMQVRRQGGFFTQFADWVRSFTTTLVVVTPPEFDEAATVAILDSWESAAIGLPADEGGISVVDGEVVPRYPKAGEGIAEGTSLTLIGASLGEAVRTPVDLPTESINPVVTDEQVDEAVLLGTRMISGDVVLSAADPEVSVNFPPELLAEALRSDVHVNSPAEILLTFDPAILIGPLETERAAIEQPARDARFRILDNEAVILEESRPQTLLNAQLVADRLAEVAVGPDRGDFPFEIGNEPTFTTEEARAMGPIAKVAAYTTEHPAGQPRVTNIHLIADAVDGTIVWPWETFSLNDHVGQRTEEKGYVPAPMILRGEIVDDVGGGVSQFATTFYNTVFFACYEDVSHRPHSFYFSRYPEGREATISWPEPDLQFRNDSNALIIMKTSYSASTITVTFFGNNGGRDCDAELSDRYDFTDPKTEYEANSARNPGSPAVVQTGSQGWSVNITRVMKQPDGAVTEEEWVHRYQARPEIIEVHPCEISGAPVNCPIAVPSVIGLTFSEATARLEEAGFLIGDGGTVEVSDAAQDGLVQSQSTSGGSFAEPGSAINVVIGVFTAPPTTPPPEPPPEPPPDDDPPPGDGG